MKRITTILLLYILLACINVQAQSIYFKNYQTHDGLSNSTVKCITQDVQGFLWLGTRNGLNRFDGNQFKIFRHNASDSTSIGSSSILSILTDSKGILWVGTTRGTYCYDPIKENFTPFRGVPIGEVNAIHEYAGFIWLLSNGKLYRYNSYTTEIIPFDQNKNTIVAITSSKKGGLWTTDNNSTIQRYQVNTSKFVEVDLKKIDRKALANTKTVYAINDSWLGQSIRLICLISKMAG